MLTFQGQTARRHRVTPHLLLITSYVLLLGYNVLRFQLKLLSINSMGRKQLCEQSMVLESKKLGTNILFLCFKGLYWLLWYLWLLWHYLNVSFLSYGVILNVHISLKHEKFLRYFSDIKIRGIRNIYIVYYAPKDFSSFK